MKNLLQRGILLFSVLMIFSASQALAGTIDFENMPQDYWYYGGQQNFGNYWQGVNFGPASTILETEVYGYNNSGYPPHSGVAVLFSISVPYIDIVFDLAVDTFSFWYTTNDSFDVSYFDELNSLIGSQSLATNYGSNSFFEFSNSEQNIKKITVSGVGNYFTIDDFTAPFITGQPSDPNHNVVPEPSTILMLGIGLLGMAASRRYRR